jgi:nitrogen regulatory protein PII-like uncharacterized protein
LNVPDDFEPGMSPEEVRAFVRENADAFTPEIMRDAQTIVALLSTLLMEDCAEEYEKLAQEVRQSKSAFDALVAFTLSGVVTASHVTGTSLEDTIQRLGNGVAVLAELFAQE